ncbi:hypothetical protein [Lactococcus lactis]|uniref:hypothetical protein n=1 Tax=Lactococcus lactis TaxID=1358 RepID=UPI001F077375|nr:hypothetical protein [Lactococcus lactis]
MNKIYKKVQNKSGQEKTDRKVLSFEVNEFIQSKDNCTAEYCLYLLLLPRVQEILEMDE